MDISTFMSWFIQQVVRIFTFVFTTLNSITFAGTSLLKVIIFINIIVPFLYLVITIPISPNGALKEGKRQKERNEIKNDN